MMTPGPIPPRAALAFAARQQVHSTQPSMDNPPLSGSDDWDAWITRIARVPYSLLLRGESGAGKGLLARQIHDLSGRPGTFINDSAPNISDSLAEAHLAGHARGAFTGADEARMGSLEAAHRGLLFLDEIGSATPLLQGILLRFLDTGSITRVAEHVPRPLDVRFVAATNVDLEVAVADGRFRADLLYRFPLTLEIPPLREQPGRILTMAREFVAREAPKVGYDCPVHLSAAVESLFVRSPWPGNFRQLLNTCISALIAAYPRPELLVCDLPRDIRRGDAGPAAARDAAAQLAWALAEAGGNKSAAARMLGVTRQTVHARVRRTAAESVKPSAQD